MCCAVVDGMTDAGHRVRAETFVQYASERDRLQAEADEGATRKRVTEMSFLFSW